MNADYDLAVDPKRLRPNLRDVWLERLVVTGSELAPAHPGMPGAGPDLAVARRNAAAVARAIWVIRGAVPDAGSYVSDARFFDPVWQQRCFEDTYRLLLQVEDRYDRHVLFVTHHGVGSDR